ncbi:hypothetical protein AWENTII_007750 [Aspergillus wentii]
MSGARYIAAVVEGPVRGVCMTCIHDGEWTIQERTGCSRIVPSTSCCVLRKSNSGLILEAAALSHSISRRLGHSTRAFWTAPLSISRESDFFSFFFLSLSFALYVLYKED